ncbi:hypothetical protein KGP26_27670 [Serratia sp. JSRIV002]|uniref:baseplate hub protein n=1 Tax=Serratia sp. JSRIV002 TaxID=2831894 RepID=UPI001CBCD053|nr:hypothetical protein [Serratia sp. JSRIV002]UAN51394.1 hypothetical protein KGP26_27670 [Serratia sp. JSRIV002]
MSIYSEKLISVEFKLASNSDEVVRLDGYRCEVNMQNAGGRSQSKIDMVIYNVNQDLSQLIVGQGFSFNTTRSVVSLLAGEKNNQVQIYQGTIFDAYVDYNKMPDVPMRIQSNSKYYYQVKPAAPNSYKGAVKVQDIIKVLAESCDYTFVNHGVDKILNDMYLVGSAINQMMDCADAADIGMTIHNGVVEISNKGGILTDIVLEVSPDTGMIGYPTVTSMGVFATMLFNPKLRRLGKVLIKSDNKAADGELTVVSIQHDISSNVPGGPWMTTIQAIKKD